MDRKDLELVLPRLDYRAYLVSASMFSIMLSGDCFSRIFDEWNGEVVGAKSEVNGRMQIMVGKQMMRLKDAPSWYLFERVCVAPDDYSLAAVQRYLFGAYCKYEFIDEQLFNYMAGTALQQVAQKVELFVRASREDGMHDHLDMTFTDFQACVAGKSEQNVRKVLPSDSELGQYEFFPIEVVDSALMSLHEDGRQVSVLAASEAAGLAISKVLACSSVNMCWLASVVESCGCG